MDPCSVQGIDRACRRQPASELVADLRRGTGQCAQLLDRLRRGLGMVLTLSSRAFEQRRQIGPLALAGVLGELPPDLPDEATGRLAGLETICKKARGSLSRGCPLVPGAQGGQCRDVREAVEGGQVSGHFDRREFGTQMIV